MKITLLTMGKTDIPWVADGLRMYSSRLAHYVLLGAVKPSDTVILLDEHGEEYTSLQFAAQVQKYLNAGKDVVFVVGGAYGFAPEVYSRASGKLSLSRMTCSHQLVRTVFAEQLYRAFTIIRSEPYHNE